MINRCLFDSQLSNCYCKDTNFGAARIFFCPFLFYDSFKQTLQQHVYQAKYILSKNCCRAGKSLNNDKINGPGVATAERSRFVLLLLLPSKNLHKLMSQRGSNQLDLGQNESALKKKRPRCCLYVFQGQMGCGVSNSG